MSILAIKRMTVPEFLAWVETQESGRYELIGGQPVAMAPERAEHVQAKRRAADRARRPPSSGQELFARLSSKGSPS